MTRRVFLSLVPVTIFGGSAKAETRKPTIEEVVTKALAESKSGHCLVSLKANINGTDYTMSWDCGQNRVARTGEAFREWMVFVLKKQQCEFVMTVGGKRYVVGGHNYLCTEVK